MAAPLSRLKKIRSLDEILTRGGQAISIYREQRNVGRALPGDDEFVRLVDVSQFGRSPIIAESLWQKFFKIGRKAFFPAFRNPQRSFREYVEFFGEERVAAAVESADRIAGGRLDLLGLKNLYVGSEIDWHREPVSSKRSPLKHWKHFDDLDCEETGNKKIVWELNRHQHFFTLGAAYWFTGDEQYGRIFARHLESWMDDNPPGVGVNWASSLEVAFRTISWIWAFHFFEHSEALTPQLFKRAIKYLFLHGRHIEKYLSKYYSPNTHLTGEALALYYLGTQIPFLERARYWRKLGEDILNREIERQIHTDGVYFEQSSWYQRYTLDIYSHYVVLKALNGSSGNGERIEGPLQKAFEMLSRITMPDGSTPIIGDDDGGRMLPLTGDDANDFGGTLAVGAAIAESPVLNLAVGARPREEVFWLMGARALEGLRTQVSHEESTASCAFPDGGYYVMRDGCAETDNMLVVDCGEVGGLAGGHGHADTLAIEVAVHGKPLLIDAGTYTYHESRELRDYFRSTRAHNTVEVDGFSSSEPGNTFSWKTKAQARIDGWIAEQRFDLFEGHHRGYERLSDPVRHGRSILFLKDDYWIIRDVIDAAGEHEAALNFHYDPRIRPEIGNSWVGDTSHRIFTFGDGGAWEQRESWTSNNHGNRTNSAFLRYVASGTGKQEFFTFLVPIAKGEHCPTVSEVDAGYGRAFVIKYRGYTDVFLYNEGETLIDNGVFSSDFRYTWARLNDQDPLPEEFVLIDGGSLKIGGLDVFEGQELTYASARRFGSELYAKTDVDRIRRPLNNG